MFGLALHIVVLKHRFKYTYIFLVDVSLLFAFYIIRSHLHRKARMQCLYGADTQGWICHWKKSICKMCCNFWGNPNDLAPISSSRNRKYERNRSFNVKLLLFMTQCRILGKFEYTRGPIFKVVLEC